MSYKYIKNTFINLGLIVGSIIFFVFILEIISRLFLPYIGWPKDIVIIDDEVGYKLKPMYMGVHQENEYKYNININSKGFRDREHRNERTISILSIGDSFTFGVGVEIDEIYPSILERRLSESGLALSIFKCGIGGYNTVQEFKLIENKLKHEKFDIVTLGFGLNDISGIDDDMTVKNGYLVYNDYNFIHFIKNHLIELYSIRWLFYRIRTSEKGLYLIESLGLREATQENHPARFLEKNISTNNKVKWNKMLLYMDKIIEICDKSNTKFVLIYIPYSYEIYLSNFSRVKEQIKNFDLDQNTGVNAMREYSRNKKVVFIDLVHTFQNFAQKNSDEPLFFHSDGHWTSTGHAVASTAIYEHIQNLLGSFQSAELKSDKPSGH